MALQKMKVKDLIKMKVDVDVYDDYTEELAIAFCGTAELTDAGKAYFTRALELEVELDERYGTAIVTVSDGFSDELSEANLEIAKEFFYSAAGWCSEKKYEEYFVSNSKSAFLA